MANKEAKTVSRLKDLGKRKVLVNLDKIGADTHIVSVVLDQDIRNGSIVKLGEYVERDYYKATVPSADENIAEDQLVFVAASILEYDEKIKEEDVVLKAGTKLRAYLLRRGEIVTITNDGIDGETVVGQFVVPQAGKVEGKASTTKSAAELNLKVIAKEKLSDFDATVLQVL